MGLNTQQKIAARAYGSGDYAHLVDIEDDMQLATKISDCGDTLFKFIMSELSEVEDCINIDEAISRMNTAAMDLQSVLDALIDSDEHAAEAATKEAERKAEQKVADHIDGYDRDDLGESPDH